MSSLAVGAEAPNFDLTSTEDAVLMLRDEVPRSAVILYFFSDPADDHQRRELLALSRQISSWRELTATALAIAPAKVDELKALQAELKLSFPLLSDDRNFARLYGVAAAEEGASAAPALFLVDRRQKVLWAQNPAPSVEEALAEIRRLLKRLPSPTDNYPRKATNRLIDRWVNQKSGLRKKRA